MRRALDLAHEGEEVSVLHDRIERVVADGPQIRHVSVAARHEERIAIDEESGMDHRILVPVPVRQAKLRVSAYLLANLFEKEKVSTMPVEEMICAVFAEGEIDRVAVYRRLGFPTDRIACREGFHRLNGATIRVDVGIDFGGAGAQATTY